MGSGKIARRRTAKGAHASVRDQGRSSPDPRSGIVPGGVGILCDQNVDTETAANALEIVARVLKQRLQAPDAFMANIRVTAKGDAAIDSAGDRIVSGIQSMRDRVLGEWIMLYHR